MHGETDTVTDPEVSRALYERASSKDKTIKLYPGMWHGLLYGEPPENLEIVFSDILNWIGERSKYGNARLERELKEQNEDSVKAFNSQGLS
jgi:acylglycerol lipase